MISDELRRQADVFIDLLKLKSSIRPIRQSIRRSNSSLIVSQRFGSRRLLAGHG